MTVEAKKIIAAVSIMLTAALGLCACQSADSQTETATNSTLPELKIGVDTLEPFFYTDENGSYAGIDADIATEACRRAGYTPNFIKIDWSNRDEYLQNGTVDCLWTAFIKNGREDLYQWTDTYLQSKMRVIVNAKSPDQDIKSTFEHGGVAVRAGSKAEEIFLENEGDLEPIQVYSCGTFEIAETAFVKDFVAGLCCHEAVLEKVMSRYPGLYRFLDGSIMNADLGVAFVKDDSSEKCQKINDAIADLKEDGTIDDISATYRCEISDAEEVSADAQK